MSGGNWKDLFAAGCRGDLELVRYHVEAGVDVNYCHPEFLCPPLVGAILELRTWSADQPDGCNADHCSHTSSGSRSA